MFVREQSGGAAVVSEPSADQFTELYCRTYRASVMLAYATTGSVTDAEDIAQEAYAQLYRSWHRIQAHEAWLLRAIISLSTTWVRHQARSRAALGKVGAAQEARPVDGGTAIWQSLTCLSPRQRAAVVLRYVEDMSERDIANALGCRPGTVKSLLSRALRRLQVHCIQGKVDNASR